MNRVERAKCGQVRCFEDKEKRNMIFLIDKEDLIHVIYLGKDRIVYEPLPDGETIIDAYIDENGLFCSSGKPYAKFFVEKLYLEQDELVSYTVKGVMVFDRNSFIETRKGNIITLEECINKFGVKTEILYKWNGTEFVHIDTRECEEILPKEIELFFEEGNRQYYKIRESFFELEERNEYSVLIGLDRYMIEDIINWKRKF